jgi:hypothetical protein
MSQNSTSRYTRVCAAPICIEGWLGRTSICACALPESPAVKTMSRCTSLNPSAMRALAIFKTRGDGTGRVVRNAAGATLTVNAHWFPETLRAAGITNFRWQPPRHTFASRLRQSGAPLGHIAELMGHKMVKHDTPLCAFEHCEPARGRFQISTDPTVAPEQKAAETEFAYRM